jgi:hypothetical protein
MAKRKNSAVFMLSVVSGLLLVVSGISGSTGVYGTVFSALALFVNDAFVLSVLWAVSLALVFLASLGGFAVMLGGYLIYRSQVMLGEFVMGLGAGVGVPGLALMLLTVVVVRDFSSIMAQYGVIGWIGIALSLVVRATAK